jgi:hypothetical protein
MAAMRIKDRNGPGMMIVSAFRGTGVLVAGTLGAAVLGAAVVVRGDE